MRRIDKGAPIPEFTQFVHTQHPVCWEDAAGVRSIWREYMLRHEQHNLSGYTELYIACPNQTHIDHFKKRSLFGNLVFCWENFVVDSLDDGYGARYKDGHIHSIEDNQRLIDPVREDASRYFQYEITGKMVPANGLSDDDAKRAQFTIDMFNLNEGSLKERRKVILNTNPHAYDGLSDEEVMEYLHTLGFPSVVEQWLRERRNQENLL